MLERMKVRTGRTPKRLAADGSYGSGPFLGWLCDRHIELHIPVLDREHQTSGNLTRDAFDYDAERDVFVCPQGKKLRKVTSREAMRLDRYRSKLSKCRDCSIKPT